MTIRAWKRKFLNFSEFRIAKQIQNWPVEIKWSYLDTHVTRGNVYERVSNGDLATCKTGLHWKTPSVHWVSVAPSGQRTIIKSKRFFDPWGDSTDLGFRYFEQLKLKFFPNGLTKEYDGYRLFCLGWGYV